jgi:hypothetical protein
LCYHIFFGDEWVQKSQQLVIIAGKIQFDSSFKALRELPFAKLGLHILSAHPS